MKTIAGIQLESSVADQLRSVFREFPAIDTVVLFGSRALGKARPGSDIDLAVFGNIDRAEEIDLRLRLDDLGLLLRSDVVCMDRISNPELEAHIKRAGKMLYMRGDSMPAAYDQEAAGSASGSRK